MSPERPRPTIQLHAQKNGASVNNTKGDAPARAARVEVIDTIIARRHTSSCGAKATYAPCHPEASVASPEHGEGTASPRQPRDLLFVSKSSKANPSSRSCAPTLRMT